MTGPVQLTPATTLPPNPALDALTFDQLAQLINGVSPDVFYQRATAFDNATARMLEVQDEVRRQLRLVQDAWTSNRPANLDEMTRNVLSRVQDLLTPMQSPGYGAILREAGDVLASHQQRFQNLQAQKASTPPPPGAPNPQVTEQPYNESAVQILEDLRTAYLELGMAFGTLPPPTGDGPAGGLSSPPPPAAVVTSPQPSPGTGSGGHFSGMDWRPGVIGSSPAVLLNVDGSTAGGRIGPVVGDRPVQILGWNGPIEPPVPHPEASGPDIGPAVLGRRPKHAGAHELYIESGEVISGVLGRPGRTEAPAGERTGGTSPDGGRKRHGLTQPGRKPVPTGAGPAEEPETLPVTVSTQPPATVSSQPPPAAVPSTTMDGVAPHGGAITPTVAALPLLPATTPGDGTPAPMAAALHAPDINNSSENTALAAVTGSTQPGHGGEPSATHPGDPANAGGAAANSGYPMSPMMLGGMQGQFNESIGRMAEMPTEAMPDIWNPMNGVPAALGRPDPPPPEPVPPLPDNGVNHTEEAFNTLERLRERKS